MSNYFRKYVRPEASLPVQSYKEAIASQAEKDKMTLEAYLRNDMALGYITSAEKASNKKIIVSIDSTNDPFVFHIKLTNKKIISATPATRWRSDWKFEYEGNTYRSNSNGQQLYRVLLDEFGGPYSEIKFLLKNFDDTYEMSDDFRTWSAGDARERKIKELYNKLNTREKASINKMFKGKYRRFNNLFK